MNKITCFTLMAVANPYVSKINGILDDAKGWIFAIIGAVTAVIVAKQGIQYQQGGADEKAQATKDIRKTIMMGGGIFMLVWLAGYVIQKMQ